MNSDIGELLLKWLRRIKKAHIAHTRSATYFERLNFILGISVIIFSTFAGTSLLATDPALKIMASIASILAAILAGLQTFLRLSERAEKHRIAGSKFGGLRREIEQELAFLSDDKDSAAFVESIRIRWENLTEGSPTAPQGLWDSVKVDRAGSLLEASKGT